MSYLEIANSKILYVIVICILGLLFTQAIFFYRMARKRALELNISSEKIRKATKAASISSIIPSIAIIIGLIAISPALGIPISWARLGMAGSLMYEITVAAIGGKSMGAAGLGQAGYTPQAFANSVWLMTLGVMPTFLLPILLLKKYKTQVKKATSKDSTFQNLILGTILICVQATFVIPPIFKGGNGLLAVVVASGLMAILTYAIVKWKQIWLKEYALSFSMIIAIVAVILFNL
ncbi:MAG: DUF5058 family protein [Firmicutes bacterium]|nr:DUF5058 family protein [Bacillota bacterium]